MDSYKIFKVLLFSILNQLQMTEISEELHPESFGSAWAFFQNNLTKIRVIWDGKDGWGYVQYWSESNWKDIPIFITKSELDNEEVSKEKVNKIFVSIKEIS